MNFCARFKLKSVATTSMPLWTNLRLWRKAEEGSGDGMSGVQEEVSDLFEVCGAHQQ